MARFLSILAASVGGGLVLGASIRLGEAIGSSSANANGHGRGREPRNGSAGARQGPQIHISHAHPPVDPLVTARLERLEEKLAQVNSGRGPVTAQPAEPEPGPQWQSALAEVVVRIDRQQSEVETVRSQMSQATGAMDSLKAMAEDLRSDLHRAISEDLDQRLTSIEEGFQVSVEAANREAVDAMVASVETRIAPRISRLESDLAGQKSAVSELRECALQSERSIHRLLGVLEKVMIPAGHATGRELFAADEPKMAAAKGKVSEDAPGRSAELRRASSFHPLNPVK